MPTAAADGVTLPFGVRSASRVQVVNKQLDPIPFVIKNAETDTTLITANQQVTSSDRHYLVSYGPESATKGVIIPLEPINGTEVVFDAAQLDSTETRPMDLYLLSGTQTLATATPVFTGLQHDPLSPQFMVQQKILPSGGSYTVKLVPTSTKTEIAEYTRSVTLIDKFLYLMIFTKNSDGREQLIISEKRAAG